MKTAVLILVGILALAVPVCGDESESPHHMVKPDGSLDMDKCGVCHNDDMSLSRSKLETCTLCHAATTHSGATEHLAAAPASVKRWLPAEQPPPALPLRDDGGIFCGTCHFFHDPAVGAEHFLPSGWVPLPSGLPEAVRSTLTAQAKSVAEKYGQTEAGVHFATQGTQALRLPVNDGSLCQRCHASMAK